MIVFKTEMEKMPSCCNYCNVKYGCRHAHLLNLNALKLTLHRASKCPLLEIPDPKPEQEIELKPIITITQHEHDLISIIKKAYPEYKYLLINKMFVNLFLAKNSNVDIGDKTRIYYDCQMELFNTDKLPNLCKFTDEKTICIEYNIDQLLSRPIRKENPNAETKI